jgi:RES domain
VLYRAFPRAPGAGPMDEGGALYVPRLAQGPGRHDNPETYGALYLSKAPESPIAEALRDYVARGVPPYPLLREGSPIALAAIDETPVEALLDLDDPRNLADRDLRPSRVATRDRERTQPLALSLYEEGVDGFEWWSTIEASWINVTLFAERAVDKLALLGEPEPLTVEHPAVRAAADAVGVLLE